MKFNYIVFFTILFYIFHLTSIESQTVNINLLGHKKNFLNGTNIAWNSFGTDVGKHDSWGILHDITFFNKLFKDVADAGGNSVRWWLHCDGRSSPEFDNEGKVTGLDPEFFDHLDAIFNSAALNNVRIILVLWSFDLANDHTVDAGQFAGKHINIVIDSMFILSYIKNCLNLIVDKYADDSTILAWEICNEPEWMLDKDGTTLQRATSKQLQYWVGTLASSIRKRDNDALITVGSASLKWNWNNPNGIERNLWSDSALFVATSDSLSFLDFYEIHYYPWMIGPTWSYSPFDHNANNWNLDKPIVIGEFPGKGQDGYKTLIQMYKWAFDSSYAGALAWSYIGQDEHGSWQDIKPGIEEINNSPIKTNKKHVFGINQVEQTYIIINKSSTYKNISKNCLIYNITGQLIQFKDFNNSLSSGIYIINKLYSK